LIDQLIFSIHLFAKKLEHIFLSIGKAFYAGNERKSFSSGDQNSKISLSVMVIIK